MTNLLKRVDYLELTGENKYINGSFMDSKPALARSLSLLVKETQNNISKIQDPPRKLRTNMIGEYYDDSKILNNESRIEVLTQELARRLKTKQEKEERKLMRSKSQSQKQPNKRKAEYSLITLIREHNVNNDNEIQEISYKKFKSESDSD